MDKLTPDREKRLRCLLEMLGMPEYEHAKDELQILIMKLAKDLDWYAPDFAIARGRPVFKENYNLIDQLKEE
jgi:hypothetical protein